MSIEVHTGTDEGVATPKEVHHGLLARVAGLALMVGALLYLFFCGTHTHMTARTSLTVCMYPTTPLCLLLHCLQAGSAGTFSIVTLMVSLMATEFPMYVVVIVRRDAAAAWWAVLIERRAYHPMWSL